MKNCWTILVPILATAALSGCAQPQQKTAVDHICLQTTDKTQAFLAAQDTLARMHFEIEKADADAGFIKTRPLPGANFFEFWRTDNVGSRNTMQANIQSIRRTTQLTIDSSNDQLCISCRVNVQQLSMPEHEVSSSSRAYEMFSKSTASMQHLTLRPEQKEQMAWLDLGNDPQLETEILSRIEKQVIAEESNQTRTTGR